MKGKRTEGIRTERRGRQVDRKKNGGKGEEENRGMYN